MLWSPMHREVISRLPPADANQRRRYIIKPGILASEVELAGGGDVKLQSLYLCGAVENISEYGSSRGGGDVSHSQTRWLLPSRARTKGCLCRA